MKAGSRRTRAWKWAALYVTALVLSHAVRPRAPANQVLRPDERASIIAALGAPAHGAPVRIVFQQVCPDQTDRPPVVLLHGSPGSKADLAGLVPTLARRRCVLVPDLPGFGASTSDLPDYSFRSHALYVREWLQTLGLVRVHVLGFSMGGGVALSLIDIDPARVTSLTMLSAVGVQEFELFGNYHVNHALHGLQVIGLWTLLEATPHMGYLDDSPLTLAYARNFFDSDQRPLRAVLGRVQVPTLIVHGTTDSRVPYDAARIHHRLIPQSELHTLDDGHFYVFDNGPATARVVAAFLDRVDAGLAPTRSTADPARVRDAAGPDPSPRPPLRGLPLYIALAVAAGLLTLVALAILVSRRKMHRLTGTHHRTSHLEIP
jgi:pimeloyl-ACP methyl ester carboxylesterase